MKTFIIKMTLKVPADAKLNMTVVCPAESEAGARDLVAATMGGEITSCNEVPEDHLVVVKREPA